MKRRDYAGDVGVSGRIILKMFLKLVQDGMD
jgi:hypothetical protein